MAGERLIDIDFEDVGIKAAQSYVKSEDFKERFSRFIIDVENASFELASKIYEQVAPKLGIEFSDEDIRYEFGMAFESELRHFILSQLKKGDFE